MLEEFEGRVAVITGAGSGIGAALARECAALSMKVVVADLDQGRADAVAKSIEGVAEAALPIAVDVADPASVDRLADEVSKVFGAPDLLCNNAGVSPFGLLWEFAPVDWNWVIGVNILGVANCIRSFVPRMIAAGRGGHIVNTASAAALQGQTRLGAYCATKHAVLGISDSLRLDLVPYGIGVSVLCPGGVNTNISQTLGRLSSTDPKDLDADVGAYIASIDASMSTAIEPERVASLVLRGVRENQPYIMTAPGQKPSVAQRCEAILAAHDHARAIDPSLP
ncbi:MAG: SDR family NAD(P)-dependent oxidoreductase [Acidimicrobiales bacterium]